MQQPTRYALLAAVLACIAAAGTPALAVIAPFTEDFEDGVSGWTNNASAPLTLVATGGPDGLTYATGTLSFLTALEGDFRIVNRGHEGASGGAFVGDWVGQVSDFSVFVRHDAPIPLTYFIRFAANPFPGAVAVNFVPVLPNTWTLLEFAIDPANPQFVSFEGSTFEGVFGNLGRVQVGVDTPAALAGSDTVFNFDVDNASTAVPEPGSIALLSMAGLALVRRRRRTEEVVA